MEIPRLKELFELAKAYGIKKIKIEDVEAEFFTEALNEPDFVDEPIRFNNEPLLSEEEILFWSSEAETEKTENH